ncbi:MAG: hypothetical protein LC777_14105 [Actinobacteria bacterium]|nr:hypothetical protein [Actinomycetota bacterium]
MRTSTPITTAGGELGAPVGGGQVALPELAEAHPLEEAVDDRQPAEALRAQLERSFGAHRDRPGCDSVIGLK